MILWVWRFLSGKGFKYEFNFLSSHGPRSELFAAGRAVWSVPRGSGSLSPELPRVCVLPAGLQGLRRHPRLITGTASPAGDLSVSLILSKDLPLFLRTSFFFLISILLSPALYYFLPSTYLGFSLLFSPLAFSRGNRMIDWRRFLL